MKVLKYASLGFVVAAAASVALAATPLRLDEKLAQLNQEIVNVLTPFQNATTKGELVFSKLRTDARHTLNVAVTGLYSKIGTRTSLTIKADDISYRYGSGRRPTTKVSGSAAIDLTKIMSTDDLNSLLGDVETIITQYVSDLTSSYGDAVTIQAKVTDKVLDRDGNYVSVNGTIKFKINLRKLPTDKKVEDVMISAVDATVSLNTKTGIVLDMTLVSNPKYLGFKEDQQGLKEALDKLLNKDPEQLQMIQDTFQQIDDIIGSTLN